MTTHTIQLHRVLTAPAERVYRAFLDPHALCKWLPPHGFTAHMLAQDARQGGSYRMAFTHFATGHSHTFGGQYLELVPHQRLRYTAQFDDPALPGTMQTTVHLRPLPCGVDVHITQEGIPEAIPPENCTLGWQQSLALLGQLVEGGEGA
mgnify:CR=1 FL=1